RAPTGARGVSEPRRYHPPHSTRHDGPMAALMAGLGWQALVTNATPEQLSLAAAVWGYRTAYRVERICHRLKSRVHIAPLFVKAIFEKEYPYSRCWCRIDQNVILR